MSYRWNLLRQKEPLEEYEVNDLKEWRDVLLKDMTCFGPTPQDHQIVAMIENKIGAHLETKNLTA